MTFEKSYDTKDGLYEVGLLEERDIDSLIEVARQWVVDRETGLVDEEELVDIRRRMNESIKYRSYMYYALRNENGEAIGCAGLKHPGPAMRIYSTVLNGNCAELVNVFLDDEYRGKGLGKILVNHVFDDARDIRISEIVWNSGPRYRDTAWEFYTKLVGEPVAIAKDYYGEGGDAPVWVKTL
jgi:ribosomal protein S18 acetylase RimI-like enzyme